MIARLKTANIRFTVRSLGGIKLRKPFVGKTYIYAELHQSLLDVARSSAKGCNRTGVFENNMEYHRNPQLDYKYPLSHIHFWWPLSGWFFFIQRNNKRRKRSYAYQLHTKRPVGANLSANTKESSAT